MEFRGDCIVNTSSSEDVLVELRIFVPEVLAGLNVPEDFGKEEIKSLLHKLYKLVQDRKEVIQ